MAGGVPVVQPAMVRSTPAKKATLQISKRTKPVLTYAKKKKTDPLAHPKAQVENRRIGYLERRKILEQFKSILASNILFINKQFRKKGKLVLFIALTTDPQGLAALIAELAYQMDLNKKDRAILHALFIELQEASQAYGLTNGPNDLLDNLLFLILAEAFNEANRQDARLQIIGRDEKFLEFLLLNGFHKKPLDEASYQRIVPHLNQQYPTLEPLPHEYNSSAKEYVLNTLRLF